jgi:response regulator RpfG family c-di-GMP phosphodiesterase
MAPGLIGRQRLIATGIVMERDELHLPEPSGHSNPLSIALGYRDLSTRLHSDRVLGLCEAIGLTCGLTGIELEILKVAASLHDIGKIGIPDRILLKPGRLDEPEWEKMKEHSAIGQSIMAAVRFTGAERAALVIRHHHEHFDGMGYPDGLSGEDIPVSSRIISIADSYDAMAVKRAYQRARTHAEIMVTLHEEAGSKHDPVLFRNFCEIIETSKFRATQT